MKWLLLIKAPLDGGRDGGRFTQSRERGRERGDVQTHFHSHHGQLHADTQTHIGSRAFFAHFKICTSKSKATHFKFKISVWQVYPLM